MRFRKVKVYLPDVLGEIFYQRQLNVRTGYIRALVIPANMFFNF